MRLTSAEFEQLVALALDELPEWVRSHMDNVAVVIAPWPSLEQMRASGVGRAGLLGLYEGVPLTHRGRGYSLAPPDRITLFQGPLELYVLDSRSLVRAIRQTIIHEIGHHFGFSEPHLRSLE